MAAHGTEANASSLRTNLLEETYEVLEAIDQNDYRHLREELGDLLLQVVLHAQIAFENGQFSLSEVIHDIHTKIINRHPHVFGETNADTMKGVLTNWEKIKEKERNNKKGDGDFNSIFNFNPRTIAFSYLLRKSIKNGHAVLGLIGKI